jgi:hypothetical protein
MVAEGDRVGEDEGISRWPWPKRLIARGGGAGGERVEGSVMFGAPKAKKPTDKGFILLRNVNNSADFVSFLRVSATVTRVCEPS